MIKQTFLSAGLLCLMLTACQTSQAVPCEASVPAEALTQSAPETTSAEKALTPTGYASNEIQRISLFYDGSLYLHHATGFDLPKEESWKLLGKVTAVDNLAWPTKDFCGTHLNVGQEIYQDPAVPEKLYIKYEKGFALFEAEETKKAENQTASPVQVGVKFCTSTELELKLTNTGSETIGYGEAYTLEVLRNDTWEPLPVLPENYGFHDILYELQPEDTQFIDIEFEWLYGELPPGRYRIVKIFSNSKEELFTTAAEFELS